MKFGFLLLYLITSLAIFVGIPTLRINAQLSNGILINVTPENPAPFEDISITLNSYIENLDNVLISWLVNGKNVLSGIGKKTLSLKAPALGLETTVLARIALPAGQVETKITIRPNLMILLWQANDSYVPPFYKGKAMPSPDSEIKIVAMPEIKSGSGLINPSKMTYNWKKDYTNDQGSSGYGKNSFIYTSDYLENSNYIEVIASTLDQKYSTQSNIIIGTTQPKILFYKNNINLGTLWGNALTDSHKIQGNEIILAAPYFFSPKDERNPRLIWNWFINDNQVAIQGFKKNLMPLQVENGVSGTSKIRLEVENKDKIFETASREINIEF